MRLSGRVEKNHRITFSTDAGTLLREVEKAEVAIRGICDKLKAAPGSGSTELRNAKALGQVVGEFFSKTETELFRELVSALKVQWEYVQEVVALKAKMAEFRLKFVTVQDVESDSYADGELRASAVDVHRQMKEVVRVCANIVEDRCEGKVQEGACGIVDDAAVGLARYDRVYAERAEEAPVEPGGTTGAVALGTFFTDHSKSERKTANGLRACVIFLLVVIAGLAAWLLLFSPRDSDTLGREFARLSTTVPLAMLAGYLSRESSRHRSAADRSGELGAHLKNLDGYIVELSEEERRRYRYELGQSAYIADKRGVSDTNYPGLVEEVARLVEAVKGLTSR